MKTEKSKFLHFASFLSIKIVNGSSMLNIETKFGSIFHPLWLSVLKSCLITEGILGEKNDILQCFRH